MYRMSRMIPGPYSGAWCHRLFSIMQAKRLTQEQAAEALGMRQGTLWGYLHGRTKPPTEKLEAWADGLKLHGSDRDQFIWLAHEFHVPILVWDRCRALAEELEATLASARDLRDRLATLHPGGQPVRKII